LLTKNGVDMKYLISILLIVSIFIVACSSTSYEKSEVDAFAKCLSESDTVMYGAFWCPHCAKTKKKFGSSFQYVNYVECDPRGDNEQSELCIEKGIEKYDTWEFSDGTRVVGEPSFELLAEGIGCTAPQEKE
jgi:thioredoxin-related protein